MVEVHHTADVEVPIEFAFDDLADLRNLVERMYGIQQVSVVGNIERGATRFDPYASITTKPRRGFVNRAAWRSAALTPISTRLTVAVSYELPRGLAGKALGKTVEPLVTIAIQRSDTQLRTRLFPLHQTHECQTR